jgi:hypothetical protein
MILYVVLLLIIGALISGYFYVQRLKKETIKNLDVVFHKGFESAMEKAKADVKASSEEYLRPELEQEKIAEIAEEIVKHIETKEEKESSCITGCGHHKEHLIASLENKPKKKKASTTKKKKTPKKRGSKK